MKKARILIALLMVALLVPGVVVSVTAAAEFADIGGHAYEAGILDLASRGYVGG